MVLIFLYGIVIGSFLNLCIYRIPRGESILFPPSHCTHCMKKIKLYYLIPIISYVFLKGRSSCCLKRISLTYPLIEFLTGIIFVMVYLYFGFGILFFKWTTFLSIIIVMAAIDFYTQDVYFSLTAIGTGFSILFITILIISGSINLWGALDYFLAGTIAFGIITAIKTLTKGMGAGDGEVFLVAGLFLGIEKVVVLLIITFVLGGVLGGILILLNKKQLKSKIPLVPFIALGSLITVIYGNGILYWYLGKL